MSNRSLDVHTEAWHGAFANLLRSAGLTIRKAALSGALRNGGNSDLEQCLMLQIAHELQSLCVIDDDREAVAAVERILESEGMLSPMAIDAIVLLIEQAVAGGTVVIKECRGSGRVYIYAAPTNHHAPADVDRFFRVEPWGLQPVAMWM